ncbi:hypothetical protein BDA99DRAFT_539937 [Phascolomyces articulosus]|uniref:Uncharacterized protein n=1 Tax=Phascolomyces articulosus TaxID=60185 RepID=A0AAD5JVE1_9FUNG|nr:hypothetical protein BDA99DRAFT_539937 [Phascolomyces articulosus]
MRVPFIELIVEWLTEPSNYNKYTDNTKPRAGKAQSKTAHCKEIVTYFMQNDIDNRTHMDIYAQIGKLVDSFNEANVFLFRTGGGVNEEDVTQSIERRSTEQNMVNKVCAKKESSEEIKVSIEDKIRGTCKYYFELEPVIRDRPSVRPPAPMFSGDEEEEASPAPTAPSIPVPAPTASFASSLAVDPSGKRAFSIAPSEEGKKTKNLESKEKAQTEKLNIMNKELEFKMSIENRRIKLEEKRPIERNITTQKLMFLKAF